MALYGTALGIAAIAGQILGGFLLQANLFNLDWRLIFLVNVPIGIGTLIAALFIVCESKSEKPIRLDIGGAAIMSVILFLLLYPLIEGRGAGWPLRMYAAIILSIILIVPFIFFERRLSTSEHDHNTKNGKRLHSASKAPIVPLLLFKDRSFVIGTSIIIVFYIGYTAFIFVLTFYLQNGLGLSPLSSGLTFLPLGVGFLVSSSLTPKIVPKLDAGILKIGAIVIIIGYELLIITAHQESNIGLRWSQLLEYMFIIGIGNGFLIVPLINIILSRVKDQHAGAASGVYNTMTAIGNAMGIAFIGSIFFGLIGTGTSPATGDTGSHTNGSYNHVRIHHFTDSLISSTLYTIGLGIATLFMVFLLPSHTSKE